MTTENLGPELQIDDPEDVDLAVRRVVARALDLEEEDVQMESSLFELGAESLDLLDMAFMLEKEYRIQFPQTDILNRADRYFGKDALSNNGVVTDLGLQLLRIGMPELPPEVVKPGLRDIDVAKMITVQSFARITRRLLEAKALFPRACAECGGDLVESDTMPEFQCAQCQRIVPVPSGDDVLLQDLIALHESVRESR
jgi:acyl carrier protein